MDSAISSHRYVRHLVGFAVLLAFIVVMLGAYTRLTDAGLGCPDWPGCYGHWVVPESAKAVAQADKLYPAEPVQAYKAWHEMVHRYAAGTLASIIFVLFVMAIVRRRKSSAEPIVVPLILGGLVIFQAALGMWTVTLLLLPTIVMLHLLCGMAVFALLWLLRLQMGTALRLPDLDSVKRFRFFAVLGLLIVFFQIMLGGWTSTNYAALACSDFPLCHGQLFPVHEFKNAFNFLMPIGANFEGGVLDSAERVTIQVFHRLGALVTAVYLLWLCFWVIFRSHQKTLKNIAMVILLILAVQICLGILNVVLMLPLPVAVMHNGVAALLLLAVVSLNYALYAKKAI